MKKILLMVMLFSGLWCRAQQNNYKVVFDISTNDSVSQQALIREVEIIKTSSPNAQVEVVIYGKGLSLALKDRSAYAAAIEKLTSMKDVSFRVCAITMKRNNVDNSNLLPNIQSVPDGIYELVSKQRDGWGYIKVAH